MSVYYPPGPSDIAIGKAFDAAKVEEGFSDLRDVLNGTVGSLDRTYGQNIPTNRQALSADSVQPAAAVEVFASNIAITGPQSYLAPYPKFTTPPTASFPWGHSSVDKFEPSGGSISFCAPASGPVFVTYEVCLEKSWSKLVEHETNYRDHSLQTDARLKWNMNDAMSSSTISGSIVNRRYAMSTATTDSMQAHSLGGFGVMNVTKGNFYSVWVEVTLNLVLNLSPATQVGRAPYMQLMGPGATISAMLFKA